MGGITGVIGNRKREIERQRQQKALWLGVYLLAGQFFSMAVPELTPIISRVTPVVTTVISAKVASKTGSSVIAESSKITEKNLPVKSKSITTSISEATSESVLKVRYFKHSYIRDGRVIIENIPDFTEYSVSEIKLPPNLILASDEAQFSKSTSLYGEQLRNNPELLEKLKTMNRISLKRDILIFEKNKPEILHAEAKMLDATKNNDVVEQAKWLKELRRLTQKITFKQTPKGKPLVFLGEDEILAKQLKDIYKPSIKSKGRIFGYVWHHAENEGMMQLVQKEVHEFNKHIGGNAIWGGNLR